MYDIKYMNLGVICYTKGNWCLTKKIPMLKIDSIYVSNDTY